MPKKKREIVVPDVGDNATFNDWLGGWVEIRVQKIGDSPVHGLTAEGIEVDGGKYRAFPISRLVEEGRATKIGHGKWDVEIPDGKVSRHRSKKAAEQFCKDNGLVFTEVTT